MFFVLKKDQVLKILSRNKILTSIKGHNSVTSMQRITGNNPNPVLDIFNLNAYMKFGEILSSCSPDIKWKQNSDIKKGL